MATMIWRIATEEDADVKVAAAEVRILVPDESKKEIDPLFRNIEVVKVLPDAN